MKTLSIVIPFLNEGRQPLLTIQSILDTCGGTPIEIIAIDDASDHLTDMTPYPFVRLVRHSLRLGSGASKHEGVLLASSDYVLIIDAHMRFRNDNWAATLIDALDRCPTSIYCTTCVQLSDDQTSMSAAVGRYYGASLRLVNDGEIDQSVAGHILEPRWAQRQSGSEYEVACILGAAYAVRKTWFTRLRGLEGLQKWGAEEAYLSLKSWMAGGDSKILTSVEIGHLFRKRAPYVTPVFHMYFNKLLLCDTLFPIEVGRKLASLLPDIMEKSIAVNLMLSRWPEVSVLRDYLQKQFSRNIYDWCQTFREPIPDLVRI
jgi:polypeptide N-acetylgalactosaminyltransferase